MIDKLRSYIPMQKVHVSLAFRYLTEKNPNLEDLSKKKVREVLKYIVKKSNIKVKEKDSFDLFPYMVFDCFCI
jgi:hypothetical protein